MYQLIPYYACKAFYLLRGKRYWSVSCRISFIAFLADGGNELFLEANRNFTIPKGSIPEYFKRNCNKFFAFLQNYSRYGFVRCGCMSVDLIDCLYYIAFTKFNGVYGF